MVLGTLGSVLLGLVVSWLVGSAIVAPRPHEVGPPPPELAAQSVTLPSESGSTLAGWHARSPGRDGIVVLLHGVRASRRSLLGRARLFREAGYSVVLIDMQAHGESPGERITFGHLERHDVRAAVDFARQEHPGEPVVVVGMSLGGAAALLATPLDIDALVLESVYTRIETAVRNRVEQRLGPLAPLPTWLLLSQLRPRLGVSPDALQPIEHVGQVGCPVLVASGTADRHATVDEATALHEAASEPRELWLAEGAGHVDLLGFAPEEYRARVLGFLERHLKTTPTSP